uniref:Uncharacterized protein n=1 Tax=uncultured bacterium contig00005 TaxID=1181497 RepID=A0A806KD36_9BACT|nr:hypothetical protein [uncultured bacterium contig00005]
MNTNSIAASSAANAVYAAAWLDPAGKSPLATAKNASFADVMAAQSASGSGEIEFETAQKDKLLFGILARIDGPSGKMLSPAINVYQPANYTEDDPVIIVKGVNTDGNPFEVSVRINDINPRRASYVEMYALDGYNSLNGKGSGLDGFMGSLSRAMYSQQVQRGDLTYRFLEGVDIFARIDFSEFLPALREMMEAQRYHGDWAGYARYKEFVDYLMEHFGRR